MANLSLHKKARLKAAILITTLLEDEDECTSHLKLLTLIEAYVRQKQEVSKSRSRIAKLRKKKQRVSWCEFQESITDTQFRRMFRMPRTCFKKLCLKIEETVGENRFKSEQFLKNLFYEQSREARTYKANMSTTGGYISGEIKVAIALRMLAGGSYLDLFLIYDIFHSHAFSILHEVVTMWFCNDEIICINGKDYIKDVNRMKEVSREFGESCKCGVFKGCIGALDGWLVKIKQPTRKDNVSNPGDFYSRKGFYGINVQVIVDRSKRVIYKSILCRGAEHDSSAFKSSDLYPTLMEERNNLERLGFYFIGDSAYSLRSFLITPFDNAVHGDHKDAFNFYHSSSRIVVECTFGEIDMRWGILWSPLKYSLRRNAKIIDACLRLHNFIVEDRLANQSLNSINQGVNDNEMFLDDIAREQTDTPDNATGVFGGEEEMVFDNRRGRPVLEDTESNTGGKIIRERLRREIEDGDWVRPRANWFRERNRVMMN